MERDNGRLGACVLPAVAARHSYGFLVPACTEAEDVAGGAICVSNAGEDRATVAP